MRLLIGLAITLYCMGISCSKDKQATKTNELQGEWRWTAQYIGSPANTQTPQSTGIEETLIFDAANNWSLLQNNVRIRQGTYRVSVDDINNRKVSNLHYVNKQAGTDSTAYYSITDSTLMFSNDLSGSIGGGSRTYVKIK